MNPTNAATARSQACNQTRTTNGDSKSKKRKGSVAADAKIEFATDFVVGALLYSLLGSHRSDAVILFLPKDEQN